MAGPRIQRATRTPRAALPVRKPRFARRNGGWYRRGLVALASAAAWPVWAGADELPQALDLEAFEDADCLEDPNSEVLLELLSEMGGILDTLLLAREQGSAEEEHIWASYKAWKNRQGPLLLQLISKIFNGPYCEPGKVASATATCLLFMADVEEEGGPEKVIVCAEDVELMLAATAPAGVGLYETRLHMFLRSPWPAFQLLDALVRLFPVSRGSEMPEMDLGKCVAHEDWFGGELEFDWPWFKASLKSSLDAATFDANNFNLTRADGPLSEQYRSRWLGIYQIPKFREAAAFASAAFYKFRRMQWEAGCHPGIVAAYLMQIVVFSVRDTEAWLQRYVGAGWRLLNLLTPLTRLMHTDWPVFRVLQLGSLLRRHPQPWTPAASPSGRAAVPRAKAAPAAALQQRVREALSIVYEGQGLVPRARARPRAVYVTAVWGSLFSRFVGPFLARWAALSFPRLLVLALDSEALAQCDDERQRHDTISISCIDAPQHFGVEAAVAKYITLAVVAQFGALAVWLDMDVYLASDPTEHLEATLQSTGASFAFMGFLSSRSLSPAFFAARGSAEVATALLRFASWLYENPYILDHQGWDAFLQNSKGDFGSGWDYKGRSINASEAAGDGLELSFAPTVGGSSASSSQLLGHVVLGCEIFASADGWVGNLGSMGSILAFHFWGAEEEQQDLFPVFYPFDGVGFSNAAAALVGKYVREPAAALPMMAAAAQAEPDLHLTAISYADGCCAQAIQRNRESAMANGFDEAISYGRGDLDPRWVARHANILSQRKGAGWWLWKPYVVLKTLLSDAVPWHRGVVVWLDAGNVFVGDPRPLAASALQSSDIAGLRLKCCIETDWTSVAALRRLHGTAHAIADRPQLGAYFLLFRKTSKTIAFVEEWLRLSEDPEILMDEDPGASMKEAPGYQKHMADQSVFSVLFKQRGFHALPLEEGHQVVRLDRWRE